MRFHSSVIEKIADLTSKYGGQQEEVRLKQVIAKLDLSVYVQKGPPYESFIVLTKDLDNPIK